MAKTTISAITRELMAIKGALSSEYRVYLKYAIAAVKDYLTTYNPHSTQEKVVLSSNLTFIIPDGYNDVSRVRVPYQGRLVDLWELPDMVDTTTLQSGKKVRLSTNGENVPIAFNEGDAVNPFGYYSKQDCEVFVYSEQTYPYLVVEFVGDGIVSSETKVDTSYQTMIEKYVLWQVELMFGTNKSYAPMYKKDYEEEALKLRNAEMRMTTEEWGIAMIHGTWTNL